MGRWLGWPVLQGIPPYVLAVPPVPLSGQGVPCLGLGRVQGVANWLVCVVNGTDSFRGYQRQAGGENCEPVNGVTHATKILLK